MAHFGFRKAPSGSWIGVTAITQADMTYFDQTLAKAINGDEGGVWSPTSTIIIGGMGITTDLRGLNRLLTGGTLELMSGSTLLLDPGATFVYPDRLVKQVTNAWLGNSTWTGTTFGGGNLQLIADLDFTTYNIQVGDQIHFSVDCTALLRPSTQAWIRLSAGEDTSYFTGGVEAGGSTGLGGSNVPGELIIGPHYYGTSFTLPTYAPIGMRCKYTVVGGGDSHVYLAMSAKVQAYDGASTPEISVDQGLGNLPDCNFTYSAQIWRP